MKQFHDTAVCIFAYIRDDSLFKLLEDIKKTLIIKNIIITSLLIIQKVRKITLSIYLY